ncbi:2267_t:CDS:1, partial [Ambispora gerdemannii]
EAINEQDTQNKDNSEALLYELNKIDDIIFKEFEEAIVSNEAVNLIFEVKLDQELLEIVLAD